MKDLLSRVRRIPVVVLGDVVVDRYVFGSTTRISREAPVPVVLHERDEVRPGGAANAAVNVASLGARCHLLGVVGRDGAAQAFRAGIKGRGVTLGLVVEAGRTTAEKTRVLAGSQGTRAQQVLRLDRDPAGPPSAASFKALVRALAERVRAGDRALLLSDYGGGLMADAVVEAVVGHARRGLPVVVDSRWLLGRVNGPVILKPNAPELAELTGLPVRTTEDVVAAATAVRLRLGASAVVATRGRDGMVVVASGRAPVVIEPHGSGEVTDVTGAGDTVAATLACALGAGIPLVEAARLANVAGSIVVQKLGAATASPAELLAAVGAEPA